MLALDIVRQAQDKGVALAPVLGDSVYGDNAEFRQGLRDLGMEFFLQVDPSKHKGWNQAGAY
jgi:SRSO17 transposase